MLITQVKLSNDERCVVSFIVSCMFIVHTDCRGIVRVPVAIVKQRRPVATERVRRVLSNIVEKEGLAVSILYSIFLI
jgi:hypothetical protein